MNRTKTIKVQLKTLILLLIFLLTSFYILNQLPYNRNEISDNNNIKVNENNDTKNPEISMIGERPWWSESFYYRRLINITNPLGNPTPLINFVSSIVFNYAELVSQGKMQADLDDIRIVENETLLKYYVKKDFNNTTPQTGVATVYFQKSVFTHTTYTNTYLYYGNSTVGTAAGYYMSTNFGLISRWGFEDGTGSSTAKDVLKTNDGTLINMDPNTDWISGQIDNFALDFDGTTDDYVRINDNPSLTVTTGLTISFWAYRHTADNWELVVGNGGGWQENGYHVMGSSSRLYRFEIQNRTGTVKKEILDTVTQVPNNQWHMITATFDGTYMSFYIDGGPTPDIRRNVNQLYSEGYADVHYIGDSSNNLHIGWHNYGPSYFDGVLDDVRIYNYELSSTELGWLYNRYKLETKLNEEQAKRAIAKVFVKDVDGNAIPNANVTILNKSLTNPVVQYKITGADGSVLFTDLNIGSYNFSVYISSTAEGTSFIELVNETTEAYLLQGIYREITLICNVGTNTLRVNDIDGAPLESGWIIVGNSTNGKIQNCTVNGTGDALFQWYNRYPYNYTVYYKDMNYNPNIVELASGSISSKNSLISIPVNFTTVNFTIIEYTSKQPVSGAKISLNKIDHPGENIVNLTTDANGIAVLRWFNSSGLKLGSIINYSMKIFFFDAERNFNITIGGSPLEPEYNFTVSAKTSYEFQFTVDLAQFKTDIFLLSPESIDVIWGSELKIRALFNITLAGGNELLLGPEYADIMSFKIERLGVTILTGTMSRETGNEGRHQGTIDTHNLEAIPGYSIEITAQKSGFTLPTPETIVLTVLENVIQLNQSQNDDLPQSVYWLQSATMSVKPYGEISESLSIQDEIFKESGNGNYNFEFSIPELSTDWNLSKIEFNIYNVRHGVSEANIELNITDPEGIKHTWTDDNKTNYYYSSAEATNGTWIDLIIEPLKDFSKINNIFNFNIGGTFSGSVDVYAIATFVRDKIEIQYLKNNVTDSILVSYDGKGWAIQNITFELTNCYNPNTWTKVNPANVINNITIDGYVFNYIYDNGNGFGKININNTILYPFEDQFIFSVGNNSPIMFDVVIKVEYIQGFYKNQNLEVFNLTVIKEDYVKNSDLAITPNVFNWYEQGAILIVSDINNGTRYFSPSEVGMNFTLSGNTYYFEEYGTLLLDTVVGYVKNTPLPALIRTNKAVNFTLSYSIGYVRTVFYEITATVTYEIREAPDVNGVVPYDEDLGYYQVIINTADIDADEYTVRFTTDKDNYNTGLKDLDLNVMERDTLINGRAGAYQLSISIPVQTHRIFEFTYIDEIFTTNITNLDIERYDWEYTGEGTSIINSGTGELTVDAENKYILDFNTELRPVGSYNLYITLQKRNYETKVGFISLIIENREFEYDLGKIFKDKQVSIVKGKTITLEIELTDAIDGTEITDAKVVLEIGNEEFEFDEKDDGVYELEFNTKDYEAFFTSNTLTGTIKISKANYTTEEVDITIVIEMEEIIKGVPTFYFLMIAGAIAAIVGSLATYRYIQIARIPTFVKKARKMKRAIKSSTEIPESLLYPSKEDYLVKALDDKYQLLGISMEDTLGLKVQKGKLKSPETNPIKKNEV